MAIALIIDINLRSLLHEVRLDTCFLLTFDIIHEDARYVKYFICPL